MQFRAALLKHVVEPAPADANAVALVQHTAATWVVACVLVVLQEPLPAEACTLRVKDGSSAPGVLVLQVTGMFIVAVMTAQQNGWQPGRVCGVVGRAASDTDSHGRWLVVKSECMSCMKAQREQTAHAKKTQIMHTL